MIGWITVGTYLSRPVRLLQVSSADALGDIGPLASSTLLLVSKLPTEELEQITGLLGLVVEAQPLAVAIFGTESSDIFDQLIRKLSQMNTPKHIMTNHIDETCPIDAMERYLSTTWPAEECFDDWEEYSVLIVGDDNIASIEAALLEKLDNN